MKTKPFVAPVGAQTTGPDLRVDAVWTFQRAGDPRGVEGNAVHALYAAFATHRAGVAFEIRDLAGALLLSSDGAQLQVIDELRTALICTTLAAQREAERTMQELAARLGVADIGALEQALTPAAPTGASPTEAAPQSTGPSAGATSQPAAGGGSA